MPSGIEERVSLELQHISVKLVLSYAEDLDLDQVIPIFHSWIQGQLTEELLLDVADYRHVYRGPGIVLIGHEADYSLDNTDNRLGLRYNRKALLEGSNEERLAQAARAALSTCQQLQEDTRLDRKLHFNGQEIEILINDRLLAPNREETREALRPELQGFCNKLFGGNEYSLSYGTDPRKLFTMFVNATRSFALEELLENLLH